MDFLLDTHVLLWSFMSPNKLSSNVKRTFLDPNNTFQVSAISFWEVSLKYSLGSLDLKGINPDEFREYSLDAGFKLLDLSTEITSSFYLLPRYRNKDPFDRMLAWQAMNEKFTLISKDKGFDDYQKEGLKRFW